MKLKTPTLRFFTLTAALVCAGVLYADGFVDDNTYEATGFGRSDLKGASGKVRACEAARLEATRKIAMKLGTNILKGAVAKSNKYDAATNSCNVTLHYSKKGLRKTNP